MTRNRTVAAATVPLAVLLLSACVSQQTYDAMIADNNKLKAQIAVMQAQSSFVEAGDLLFPEGGYRLSPAGQAELANNIAPKLRSAPPNSKFVVYGYTDNLPIGPALQQQGIPDNLVLSTRRAAEVVTFLISQGVPAASISAKGFGDTRPVASNDTPQGRAQNRRIETYSSDPAPDVGGEEARRTSIEISDQVLENSRNGVVSLNVAPAGEQLVHPRCPLMAIAAPQCDRW